MSALDNFSVFSAFLTQEDRLTDQGVVDLDMVWWWKARSLASPNKISKRLPGLTSSPTHSPTNSPIILVANSPSNGG